MTQLKILKVVKMKSNFNKSKSFAPKNNKKRKLHQSTSSGSSEPVKTKPLNIEAIKNAQIEIKNQDKESESDKEKD